MINEGDRYTFGAVDTRVRLRDLEPEELAKSIEFETGDYYDAQTLDESVDSLTHAVGALGYALWTFGPHQSEPGREDHRRDL